MDKDGPLEAPPSQEEAELIFEHFRQVMEMGARDPSIGHRLALAQTVAEFHATDAEGLVVTALLDREPIEMREGRTGDAEVEIFISSRDLDRFWTGDMHLAMALAEGQVRYRGPVRKFLRVVPIARRLTPAYLKLAGVEAPAAAANGSAPAAEAAAVQPPTQSSSAVWPDDPDTRTAP